MTDTPTTDYDYTDTDFSAMTVGELLALVRNPGGTEFYRRNVPTADLLKLAQVGQDLFCDAVLVADDQDNAEFFAEAFNYHAQLVHGALERMELDDRDTRTGQVTVSRWPPSTRPPTTTSPSGQT